MMTANSILTIINQLFAMQQKLKAQQVTLAERNFTRIWEELETNGYLAIDPEGKPYKETDADLEATIAGAANGPLKITRVLKPVVYHDDGGQRTLLQKGVVIVEAK